MNILDPVRGFLLVELIETERSQGGIYMAPASQNLSKAVVIAEGGEPVSPEGKTIGGFYFPRHSMVLVRKNSLLDAEDTTGESKRFLVRNVDVLARVVEYIPEAREEAPTVRTLVQ